MAAPPSTAPATGGGAPTNPRFELFDSLRAIAALSVFFFHAGNHSKVNVATWYGAFTSKLNLGVTLFFLISGFLLYRPHVVQMLGGPRAPSLRDYALRRAFRIFPAYWVALTLLALWPGLPGVFTKDWWVYYGLLQSYSLPWLMRGIAAAWSLSVEIAFYAFLPLFGWAISSAGRPLGPRGRMSIQLLALVALGAGGLVFRTAAYTEDQIDLFNTFPAYGCSFAAGMALAAASAWVERREHEFRATRLVVAHPGLCWAGAAALFLVASLSGLLPRPLSRVPMSAVELTAETVLYTSIAFLVMLPAVFGEHAGGLPRRLLRSRVLAWIGKISYGLFLWHSPLLRVVRVRYLRDLPPGPAFVSLTLWILPLALFLGWLSWHLVELPALRAARSLGARGILGSMGSARLAAGRPARGDAP
jgi:peptidoglycan/LPS O-acetylase OafA/YrhL